MRRLRFALGLSGFLVRLASVAMIVFAALLLLLRFVFLPQIENYRGDVERQLSRAIQLPVSIGGLSARMQGIRPRLELRNLTIKDASGLPALSFDNVIGVVGWTSLVSFSPRFYLLEVNTPVLAVRRDAHGQLFVAGLAVKPEAGGPDISAWVLSQHTVAIHDATVTWTDELRQAAPLTLQHLNLRLEDALLGHRFGVTAVPPPELAAPIDFRGEFRGDSLNDIAQWKGELYGNVGYTDLAGWRPWIDYPVPLTHGRGAARVWLDFAGLKPTAMTADLALAEVQVRLAPELSVLSLHRLNGRVAATKSDDGFTFSTNDLSLTASDGVKLPPTDVHVERNTNGGEFSANTLDLHGLSALAAYLPLPQSFRQQLAAYAPSGSIEQFRVSWRGKQSPFERYKVKGRFNKLAFSSVDRQPGFSGLTGSVDGDQDSGEFLLSGRNATATLPQVFLQPLPFEVLDAGVRWKQKNRRTELEITQIRFRNADAEGTASGSYQFVANGAGVMNLDAKLTRAEASAVWRYMPLQAGADVGPFLHAGLSKGKVSAATLKLQGDLDKFPFADRSGTFRIHGVFHDAALLYAEGWPQIEGVVGEIDFDGPKMTITAIDGRISGARIGPATAEIPDLVTMDEQLLVSGKATGETANFLKFIEASPVGEQIDHFTENMTANGSGSLDIKLQLPLRRINQSKVNGKYAFDGNRLVLDPDMPPLSDVRGQIEFSGDGLAAKSATATMLGLPFKLDLKTQSDGSVLAEVSGNATAAQLRKQFAYPALKNLSGVARWSGIVRARKNAVEVRISSDLVGLASTLPEPFGKAANEAMPLLIERKPTDARLIAKKSKDRAPRETTDVSVGRALRAQLIYRDDAGHSNFERGLISVGDVAVRMPDRGLTVAVFQPRINADAWRTILAGPGEKAVAAKTQPAAAAPQPAAVASSTLSPNRIDLRTPELKVMGRVFHDVKLSAARPAAVWNTDINSREFVAKLDWLDGDVSRLSGRISRFVLPDAEATNATNAAAAMSADVAKSLPNLDLTLDHLAINGRDYGELRIAAENKGTDWNSNFTIRNDESTLEGQGRWRIAANPALPTSDTQLDFKLRVRNIDRFLNRIGYPNTVKRGNADLNGKLTWKGAPQDLDFSILNGQLSLEAKDGQFAKLEPGVGRLLGVLSLQSITRRITLDFRDVFSEGFAFDTVKGQFAINSGVMDTQSMEIRGPAARVQMAGNLDLVKETQDLKVRVQPKLGESVSTGVLFVNPAVGATAWVFNKMFGNPLDNAFSYDFAVTGSWAEPKVDKVGALPGSAAKVDGDK